MKSPCKECLIKRVGKDGICKLRKDCLSEPDKPLYQFQNGLRGIGILCSDGSVFKPAGVKHRHNIRGRYI